MGRILQLNDAIIPSQAPGSARAPAISTPTPATCSPARPTSTGWRMSAWAAPDPPRPVGVTFAAPTAVTLRSLRAGPASGLEVTTYVTIAIVAALALAGLADAACATVRRRK